VPTYLICVALSSGPAQAQYRQREEAEKAIRGSKLTTEYIKTGLFVISGGGSNTVLRLSANGLIMVDGKLPGNYEAIMAQARRISEQPVRALILTDTHEHHTGTNQEFLAAGAGIVMHESLKLQPASSDEGDSPKSAIFTYDRERTIKLGGVEVQLMHFGNAHTGGDTVVYFPYLKVVAVGDLYSPTPEPDFSRGGSLTGWGPVLGEILKLDFDIVVPGNGPVISRAELERFKARIDTLVTRAAGLVQTGVAKDRLLSELNTAQQEWQFDLTPECLSAFYDELARAK
jgi:glyoxylase-like metal-dependent hydrolase (beta-lactamase superfamily II)